MLLRSLTRFCVARSWVVVAVWVAVLVAGVAGGGAVFGRLGGEGPAAPRSESALASAQLAQLSTAGPTIYAVADGRPVGEPGLRAGVAAATAAIRGLPEVLRVVDGVSTPDPKLVATDGRAVIVAVTFRPDLGPRFEPALTRVMQELRSVDAPRVLIGGGPLEDDEMDDQAAADLARAELLSLPVVLVLLLVVFGGFVAAGLPLLVALTGVATSLLVLLGASYVTDLSVYSVNVITMLGLGLAVDYALLVVSRFREERRTAGGTPGVAAAVEATMATAGRTVLFSGLTVAVSLSALLVFDDPFLRSMAVGGIGVVLADLLAALTLLPAVLALVGHRIRAAAPARADRGVFVTVSRLVRRRAGVVAAVVGVGLAVLALPFLDVRYADPDARSLPADSTSRQLSDLAQTRFAAGTGTDPVVVVATRAAADGERAALAAYAEQVRALPGVVAVTARDVPAGSPPVLDVTPQGLGQGETARAVVAAVRSLEAPLPVRVTGSAARLADRQDALAERMPWALTVLVLSTFALLFAFTGSLVVPVKAIVMNVLSLGATFGALVWVFQQGHLAGLVGAQALGAVDLNTPLLVFAIAFGLSMDYEVFLLSRIQEEYRRTGDNALAVERGLQATGRIVTAAALLLVVVFAAFVAGGFSPIKQIGLGLALAVTLDATVVRMLLVPATMTLLGSRNWWAPQPLARWHERFGLSEAPTTAGPGAPVPAVPAAGPAARVGVLR